MYIHKPITRTSSKLFVIYPTWNLETASSGTGMAVLHLWKYIRSGVSCIRTDSDCTEL